MKIPRSDHQSVFDRFDSGELQITIAYDYGCTPAAVSAVVRKVRARMEAEKASGQATANDAPEGEDLNQSNASSSRQPSALPPIAAGEAEATMPPVEEAVRESPDLNERETADADELKSPMTTAAEPRKIGKKRGRKSSAKHDAAQPPLPDDLLETPETRDEAAQSRSLEEDQGRAAGASEMQGHFSHTGPDTLNDNGPVAPPPHSAPETSRFSGMDALKAADEDGKKLDDGKVVELAGNQQETGEFEQQPDPDDDDDGPGPYRTSLPDDEDLSPEALTFQASQKAFASIRIGNHGSGISTETVTEYELIVRTDEEGEEVVDRAFSKDEALTKAKDLLRRAINSGNEVFVGLRKSSFRRSA